MGTGTRCALRYCDDRRLPELLRPPPCLLVGELAKRCPNKAGTGEAGRRKGGPDDGKRTWPPALLRDSLPWRCHLLGLRAGNPFPPTASSPRLGPDSFRSEPANPFPGFGDQHVSQCTTEFRSVSSTSASSSRGPLVADGNPPVAAFTSDCLHVRPLSEPPWISRSVATSPSGRLWLNPLESDDGTQPMRVQVTSRLVASGHASGVAKESRSLHLLRRSWHPKRH